MAKKSKKSKKTLSVSFKGVEGKRKLLPEDDYKIEVEEVTIEDGNEYPYLAFTYFVAEGKQKGAKLWDNCSTSPKALWRLRSVLECLGADVPEDEVDIDSDFIEDLVGRQMIGVVAHEKDDEGKPRARLVDFYNDDEEGDEDGEDEEDEDDRKSSKKSKKKSSDDDGDEDGEDEGDESEDDEDEDAKKKRRRAERRKARKERKGDDDGDEDDEDDKKSKKSKKDKKKSKKVDPDTVAEADEEELEAMVEEHELEVDLDDYKTLKKKRAAVHDALEDAGKLDSDD